ncbi:MAG TPA: conjugal transfer protein TraG N-terminal domain-containing protein, partial [Gammaproteobacteria bacterium]|nr:conjugal transfer protein TraG N-terminal domain-containing protein [Gammaproteobacteria bacterium]
DIEESQVPTALKWGRPNCKIWWNDAENGLFKKLKDTLPPNFLTSLMHLGGDTEKIQEVSIQRLINHNFHSGETMSNRSRGYESLENNTSGNFISRYIGAPLGILYESFSSYPKLHLLINALPIIQGSLLFALYAFLAIAIPFSSYRVGFCVTVAVVMFSLIFCSYLWQLVQWFDSYLIRALYPSIGDVAGLGILNAENGKTTNQLFVEMIVGTLYVVLPLLWMTVMGWVGFEIGGFVTGLFNRVDAISKSASDGIGSVARKKLL